YLVAAKTGFQTFPQFAAGIYFEVAARVANGTQNSHRRKSLRRVAKLQRAIDDRGDIFQPGNVMTDPRFAENKKRRTEFVRKPNRVGAVNVQAVFCCFKKTGYFPRFRVHEDADISITTLTGFATIDIK